MVTLKTVLRTNALSCIGFGLVFLCVPSAVAGFLSTENLVPKVMLIILGVVLIINGLHLAWASSKPMPSKSLILYFSIGDFLWVISTLLLILFGLWITTFSGIIATLLVSALVGALGVLQIINGRAV